MAISIAKKTRTEMNNCGILRSEIAILVVSGQIKLTALKT
jgi:hypothetical protein